MRTHIHDEGQNACRQRLEGSLSCHRRFPLRRLIRVVRPNLTIIVLPNSSQLRFKPGDHPDDHRYLFEGHPHLLTEVERRAWTRIMMLRKVASTDSPSQQDVMTRRWLDADDAVTCLLQQGEGIFFAEALGRVLREQPDRLRTCPQCGSLCRTAQACLCPHCSHTWYEARQIDQSTSENTQ